MMSLILGSRLSWRWRRRRSWEIRFWIFVSLGNYRYNKLVMAKVLNFKVIIEQDEDGYFVADVPSVPGCHSQGKTYEKALANIKEALGLCLEVAGGFSVVGEQK